MLEKPYSLGLSGSFKLALLGPGLKGKNHPWLNHKGNATEGIGAVDRVNYVAPETCMGPAMEHDQ